MRHLTFGPEQETYKVAVLIKDTSFNGNEILRFYVEPLGLPLTGIIAFTLDSANGTIKASGANQYLSKLLPVLKKLGINHLYCADALYFKQLTGVSKADAYMGYVLPCKIKGYEHFNVVCGLNYGALVHNPNLSSRLDLSIQTLKSHLQGTYREPGSSVIRKALYLDTPAEIEQYLKSIAQCDKLVVDIETFSLNPFEAGIATLAVCHAEGSGAVFTVDWHSGSLKPNNAVRELLKSFLSQYQGTLVFHNAAYDLKVIIATLWMEHIQDFKGMNQGIQTLCYRFEDTKILAYLNLNTTVRVPLDLKSLTQDYLGNYALSEIGDISKVPLDRLQEYNLLDTLGTWKLYEKFRDTALQESPDIFKLLHDTTRWIIQAELVGMPIDPRKVRQVEKYLTDIHFKHQEALKASPLVQKAEYLIQLQELQKANAKLKVKQHTIEKFKELSFNPNSNKHLAVLLHEVMQLPVLDRTPSGESSTGADTLGKLLNHTSDPEAQAVLNSLIGLAGVNKILTAFIPAFKEATVKPDGMGWLHASFNVTGTVSGRMSCSNPNLQQIPSGSEYGKVIKSCFRGPAGWLLCGADFQALEDKINTILTSDPNKMKIWTQGYDSHCYRAYYYFRDQMPDIEDTVGSINSIKSKYPHLRNAGKAPSFALQYAGTWTTLVKNCGFSEEQAKSIESSYHTMYAVSAQWSQTKLNECVQQGYTRVAFGLKIRTPLLARTVLGTSKTPREAQAEARSVGNAISGQSYGLLTNRAAVAFMERVAASKYRDSIYLVSMIHDAIYLLIRDDLDTVTWANEVLIEEMQWQELPEIQSDELKLTAELDVFYEGWHKPITLPNHATREQVYTICRQSLEKP